MDLSDPPYLHLTQRFSYAWVSCQSSRPIRPRKRCTCPNMLHGPITHVMVRFSKSQHHIHTLYTFYRSILYRPFTIPGGRGGQGHWVIYSHRTAQLSAIHVITILYNILCIHSIYIHICAHYISIYWREIWYVYITSHGIVHSIHYHSTLQYITLHHVTYNTYIRYMRWIRCIGYIRWCMHTCNMYTKHTISTNHTKHNVHIHRCHTIP